LPLPIPPVRPAEIISPPYAKRIITRGIITAIYAGR
jgi:hypothetical protein